MALVGHEPDIGHLAAKLIGLKRPLEFRKGAVCRIDVDGLPPGGLGQLRWFVPPTHAAPPGLTWPVPSASRSSSTRSLAWAARSIARGVAPNWRWTCWSPSRSSPTILITARAGHAAELARGAVDRGAHIVVAWGGDGTVNEVATALVGTSAALAVIPAGSGNGLARMLGMPAGRHAGDWPDPPRRRSRHRCRRHRRAPLRQRRRRRLRRAHRRRICRHRPRATRVPSLRRHRRRPACGATSAAPTPWRSILSTTARPTTHRAFLLSFANGRQWGNGAIIAPSAELDDGALEAVVVEDRGRGAVLRSVPRLFTGTIAGAPGVSICRIQSAIVSGDGPLLYHADGEPHVGGPSLRVSIQAPGLRLRA